MLLLSSKAELAASTDARREADADELADVDRGVGDVGTEGDDAADAFVPADVGELDGCDGVPVGAGGDAGFGVKVWGVVSMDGEGWV